MAKLHVAYELLERLLWAESRAVIVGIVEDQPDCSIVTFEVRGRDVPDAAEVRLVVTQAAATYEFKSLDDAR